MHDTNGLTLDDFYPYGEQHEDTVKANENLPIAPLLEPINNLIEFGLRNLKATRYEVSINHWFDAVGAWSLIGYITFEDTPTGPML